MLFLLKKDLKKEVGAVGKNLYALQCDIAVESEIKTAFKWIRQNLQKVHILINNAGVFCGATLSGMHFSIDAFV